MRDTSITAQMIKSRKEWTELWYNMARGSKSEYDKIVQTDIFEFWTIYDLWVERIKAENARAKQK